MQGNAHGGGSLRDRGPGEVDAAAIAGRRQHTVLQRQGAELDDHGALRMEHGIGRYRDVRVGHFRRDSRAEHRRDLFGRQTAVIDIGLVDQAGPNVITQDTIPTDPDILAEWIGVNQFARGSADVLADSVDVQLDLIDVGCPLGQDRRHVMPLVVANVGIADDVAAVDLDADGAVGAVVVLDAEDPLQAGVIRPPSHDRGVVAGGFNPGGHRSGVVAADALIEADGHCVVLAVEGHRVANLALDELAGPQQISRVHTRGIRCRIVCDELTGCFVEGPMGHRVVGSRARVADEIAEREGTAAERQRLGLAERLKATGRERATVDFDGRLGHGARIVDRERSAAVDDQRGRRAAVAKGADGHRTAGADRRDAADVGRRDRAARAGRDNSSVAGQRANRHGAADGQRRTVECEVAGRGVQLGHDVQPLARGNRDGRPVVHRQGTGHRVGRDAEGICADGGLGGCVGREGLGGRSPALFGPIAVAGAVPCEFGKDEEQGRDTNALKPVGIGRERATGSEPAGDCFDVIAGLEIDQCAGPVADGVDVIVARIAGRLAVVENRAAVFSPLLPEDLPIVGAVVHVVKAVQE